MTTAPSTRMAAQYECSCGTKLEAHGSDAITAPWCGQCRKPMKLVAANAAFQEVKARRDALEINTGQLDKEFNSAWRKVRRLQGW